MRPWRRRLEAAMESLRPMLICREAAPRAGGLLAAVVVVVESASADRLFLPVLAVVKAPASFLVALRVLFR